ncbi:MAG: GAF domain-containing protein [Chitinophagaceae bacterium]|nr:GAF domain-containing protein [Chitinophagaceae bacterium]
MNLKNLTNKDNITITNCDAEPIHIPGSIQSYGYLLALNKTNNTIQYCSENCTTLFSKPLNQILSKPFSEFFNKEDETSLAAYSAKTENAVKPFAFSVGNQSFHITAFSTKENIVMEFEPFSPEGFELPDLFFQTKRFAYSTERADNLQMLCQDVADETRTITGYDRVMIYRFDKDNNGQVFAESRIDKIEPFLGLYYPATDIPVQTRELFLLNSIRMLANVQATNVPLYALDENADNKSIDLSLSILRSFSPMHIQYLKNMGVGATFTIALINHGKLWGLIACHHYAPKHIPYHVRLAAHLQGIFLSSQIDVRQVADEFELVKETEKKLDSLHKIMTGSEKSLAKEQTLVQLKNLLNADAVVIAYKETFYKHGLLLQDEKLNGLMNWLDTSIDHGIFQTSKLGYSYPQAAGLGSQVAGVVYLPIGTQTKNGIAWIRQEVEKTVNWGGDPSKPMNIDAGNQSLTPRKSFVLWKEAVKGQSAAWQKPEINAASVICSYIQHQFHLSDMQEEEHRYLNLNERLKKANEELENMNWISTHDLKEPLRKIQIYASIILQKHQANLPELVTTNILRMQSSAARMQNLVDALLSYTKVINEEKQLVNIDLNVLLDEIQADLKESIEEKAGHLQWGNLPVIQGITFLIRQLFENLINNSLKFTKEGRPPVIIISSQLVYEKTMKQTMPDSEHDYYKITVADNGVGFNPAYKKELFRMFQRFHGKKYIGTGIGLSICQKIAEAHNGFIEAEGEEGKGAAFNIYLPINKMIITDQREN